jgi:hypothetical protein
MRSAIDFLRIVEELRRVARAVDGDRPEDRLGNPDEGHAAIEVKLNLFGDIFLGVRGRENLDNEDRHSVDQPRAVRIACGCVGGDVCHVDADHRIGVSTEPEPGFANENLPPRFGLPVKPNTQMLGKPGLRPAVPAVSSRHRRFLQATVDQLPSDPVVLGKGKKLLGRH